MRVTRRRILVAALFFLIGLLAGGIYVACDMLGKAIWRAAHVVGPHLMERKATRFRADAAFTPAERVLILAAVAEIAKASDGCVQPSVSFETVGLREAFSWRKDGRATIYRAASWREWAHHLAKKLAEPDHCVGLSFTATGDIFVMVSPEYGEANFRNTVAHEIIHVALESGWHSPDKASLMYHTIGGGKQGFSGPEAAKLRALCSKR